MKLFTEYSELADFIERKTGKEIDITYASTDTLALSYTFNYSIPFIGERSKDVKLFVSVDKIDGTRITAHINADGLAGFVLDYFNSFIIRKLPSGLVERFTNRTAIINLAAVPEARQVLDSVIIQSLDLDYSGVNLTVCLR